MTDQNELIITRVFDAPVETVWKYWTEPEYVMKWWGPKDFTAPECKIDFKVGGKYLNCMQASDSATLPAEMRGQKFWSTGTYKEIVPMNLPAGKAGKIVVTDSFADEQGNVVSATHYGMEGFPMELQVTIEFEGLGDPSTLLRASKTKMTLKHEGITNIDDKMRSDMEQGWNESFDKIDGDLKRG